MFGVGWGANQFTPMLLVYRQQEHLTESMVTGMFATYAVGLIPALLGGAALAKRFGYPRVMHAVLVASALASVLLIFGTDATWALFAGRLLAGAASGAAFGPGSTWIKELSASAPPGAGARRAAVALSAGFGGGPLLAGLAAQWLPAPEVLPYVVHIVLMGIIAPFAWRTPEVRHAAAPAEGGAGQTLRSKRFLRLVVPTAPWVFATPTVSFAVLPGVVAAHTGSVAIAASGVTAGVTLGAGILVQPSVRRLHHRWPSWTLPGGLMAVCVGFVFAAVVAATESPALLIPAAAVLGCAYGTVLVGGLHQVERLTDAHSHGPVTAVFYCLTYVGFAAPYLVAVVAGVLPVPVILLAGAALTLITAPFAVDRAAVPVAIR